MATLANATQITSDSGDFRQKIQNLDGLPPFPAIASQILMECQKPEVDTRTVCDLVECEPAICAKVLQLSNSPMYAASRPIVSINHAVVLLGFSTVSQMAITIAASRLFEEGDPALARHRRQTLRQSLACAIVSRVLAGELDAASTDEAFLSGVMHDVGKLVFFEVAPQEYCQILDQAKTDNTTSEETEAFGVDHAEVGKRCGAKWGFPSSINNAIALHHKSPGEIEEPLSMAVMAGNYFSHLWNLANNTRLVQPAIPEIDEMFAAVKNVELKELCADQFETVIEICAA